MGYSYKSLTHRLERSRYGLTGRSFFVPHAKCQALVLAGWTACLAPRLGCLARKLKSLWRGREEC